MTKKVLIITYYWPPAGGSGVQRWLKLSKYLVRLGVEPIILTVDPKFAAYPFVDNSLQNDVVNGVKVFKTKAYNPIALGTKILGANATPKAGFAGGKRKGILANISLFLRTHLFIPDPRKGWNKFAYSKALDLVVEHNPDVVITTGPPQSTHLIGLKLRERLGINWIADFRDPWTDIYYYNLLNHTFISKYLDKKLESKVINSAHGLITVSDGLKSLLRSKLHIRNRDIPISIIPNGFDSEDFDTTDFQVTPTDPFTITYLGTLAKQYNPTVFLQAIQSLNSKGITIRLRFIGTVANEVRQEIERLNLLSVSSFEDYVPHTEVPKILSQSHALFLAIPQTDNDTGILTGKLFEYLASLRPIIAIGPPNGDASQIIESCRSGKMFDRNNKAGIEQYINYLASNFVHTPNIPQIKSFSRSNQAEQLVKFMDMLNN